MPLSTYELGLWITDNKTPPRPLSAIVKTLASDGYIIRQADAGKRSAYWSLSLKGFQSLSLRSKTASRARAWLTANPNFDQIEVRILAHLASVGEQSPHQLASALRVTLSPIRTGLKRLYLRGFVRRPQPNQIGYRSTHQGVRALRQAELHFAQAG